MELDKTNYVRWVVLMHALLALKRSECGSRQSKGPEPRGKLRGKNGEHTPRRAAKNDVLQGVSSPVYIHVGKQSCESLQIMSQHTT